MKELNYKLGIVCMSLLLAIVVLLTGRTITGYYLQNTLSEAKIINIFIGIIVIVILSFFIYINRGNLKGFAKNLISTFAIFAGLYVLLKFVKDIELISALISLTFGVWAIIWTLNARNVLSKGSSIRSYTGYFFFCLLFVLLFSIWDATVNFFKIEGLIVYIKYIIIILIYTSFVFASYKIYKIGTEFGFVEESKKIKKVMSKQKKKKLLKDYIK